MKQQAAQYWSRKRLQRLVFAGVLLSLAYRFFSHTLMHQMTGAVLIFPYVDLTYWGLHLMNIPQGLAGNYTTAVVFDVLLVGAALGSFWWWRSRIFPLVFSLLFLVYFVSYNSFGAHHTHCMVGVLIVSVPFWWGRGRGFDLAWEGLRFFTLWVYFSAFLWKLLRGSLWNYEQGAAIFMNENATHIALNPDAWMNGIYAFFISHPTWAFWATTAGILMEACFVIGFFTKRYDTWWLILPIIFHTLTFFFIHVFFFELLVLNVCFLKRKQY